MKYVLRTATGTFDLTRYEEYLEQERGALAACIHGSDLLTVDRFIPTGPGSFHDSRFETIVVAAGGTARVGYKAEVLRVELRLRGPYFDRHFELRYQDVASCSLQAPAPLDDLLMHEVRLEHGVLVHELQFDKGKTIAITCREMLFAEKLETGGDVHDSGP